MYGSTFSNTQKSFSWLIKKHDLSLKKNFSRRVEKPREKLCLGWLLLLFVFRCFCLALEAACLCGSTSSSSTSSRCRDGSTAPNLCISPLVININFQAFNSTSSTSSEQLDFWANFSIFQFPKCSKSLMTHSMYHTYMTDKDLQLM